MEEKIEICAQRKSKIAAGEPTKLYNFKFQLQRPNPAIADEYFWSSIDEPVAKDIENLNQEITRVIPSIKERSFVLKWVDSDGTERPVSNNEDLETALNETSGPIYK